MFKVEDDADSQFGDAEIIQHLSSLVVGDATDHFGVHDNGGMGDQVWNELTHLDHLVEDIEYSLLVESDAPQRELNDKRIFENLFVQTMPDAVQDLYRASDHLIDFVFENEFTLFHSDSCQ